MKPHKILRVLFVLMLLLGMLFMTTPVTAACQPDQVFASQAPLQFSINGSNYKPMPEQAAAYLKTIIACSITSSIPMGSYQALGFLADGDALTVRATNAQVYVYRAWKIYPISIEQWGSIVGRLSPKRWGV